MTRRTSQGAAGQVKRPATAYARFVKDTMPNMLHKLKANGMAGS